MAIKMVHHVCIQTEKYKESLDFYNKILYNIYRKLREIETSN